MAKNILISLLFLIAVGEGIYIALNAERGTSDTTQSEAQIKAIQRQRDSLQTRLEMVRDTLETAYLVANNARIDATKAGIESRKWRNQYESIRFKPYTDKQRDSVWTALYAPGDSVR